MKRIVKSFIDDPEYINPKEVVSIFKRYREYLDLDTDEEGLKIEELSEDIRLKLKMFTPSELSWELQRHGTKKDPLILLVISEKIFDKEDPFEGTGFSK